MIVCICKLCDKSPTTWVDAGLSANLQNRLDSMSLYAKNWLDKTNWNYLFTNRLKSPWIVKLLLSNREIWELESPDNTFADENSPRRQLWETFCCYLLQCYNCHLRKVSLSPWSTQSVIAFELTKGLEELMKMLRALVLNDTDGVLCCKPPWLPVWS